MITKRLVPALLCAFLLVGLSPVGSGAIPSGTKVQTYKGGLNGAIDMAWAHGTNKVFFTEKSGAIRVMRERRLLTHPCTTLGVNDEGERGLLGIALDPRYHKNHKLYVYYTDGDPLENRVARFVVERNRCRKKRVIISGIASSTIHNGGQIEVIRDKIYVSVGEAGDPSQSQDTQSRLGKVLRYNTNGTIPEDNPFGNAVWSYGHRNPFGLTHEPGTTRVFSTENGPDCDDELNRIRKGRNYGWGDGYECGTAGVGPNPKGPLLRWSSVIVPTDPWWYDGRMRQLNGSLYVGDHSSGRLHRILLNHRGTKVRGDRVIHDADEGIVDVSKGPGGWLYFVTGSTIFRIVPE
jgi:glucose/arabinose dehydrogenase